MQTRNWNDLRYLLAIKRGQTLTAAARLLGVDDTTVSRRLKALQATWGMRLLQRQGDGNLLLTPAGEAVAHRAEVMEHQFNLIGAVVGAVCDPCIGVVRLTSVPIMVNRLLAPAVQQLLDGHAGLQVELIPESRDLSLTRREADLAIRLARPTTGGTNVKARRIGMLNYSAYASETYSPREVARLPWITFDDAMSHLPQAQWMARAGKGVSGGISGLRVRDAETAMEAAVAGLGRTLLPNSVGDRDTRLRRAQVEERQPCPYREIWPPRMLTNSNSAALRL